MDRGGGPNAGLEVNISLLSDGPVQVLRTELLTLVETHGAIPAHGLAGRGPWDIGVLA